MSISIIRDGTSVGSSRGPDLRAYIQFVPEFHVFASRITVMIEQSTDGWKRVVLFHER